MTTSETARSAFVLRDFMTARFPSSTRLFSFGSLLVLSDADEPVDQQIVDIDAAIGQMRALKAALLKAAK